MTDKNINNFIDTVIERKAVIISIIFVSIFSSLIYVFSATNLYKTSIYIIPPQAKDINALNVKDRDGNKLTGDEQITSHNVYTFFMVNAQSRKYQRDFFFKNKLFNEFHSDKSEQGFKDFHKNMSFIIQSKVLSRDARYENFLTVSFTYHDSVQAANILNAYIDTVIKKTSKELVNGVNQLIQNKRASLQGEITSKINLARRITQDRIVQLEEALKIAQKLNIIEMQVNATNQQSVIISEENLLNNNPLYLYGSKALAIEIEILSERSSEESFVPGLRALQQQADTLNIIKVQANAVQSAQIDQKALPTTDRHSPKRKLIVFLGAIFGVFVALLYVFLVTTVYRRKA